MRPWRQDLLRSLHIFFFLIFGSAWALVSRIRENTFELSAKICWQDHQLRMDWYYDEVYDWFCLAPSNLFTSLWADIWFDALLYNSIQNIGTIPCTHNLPFFSSLCLSLYQNTPSFVASLVSTSVSQRRCYPPVLESCSCIASPINAPMPPKSPPSILWLFVCHVLRCIPMMILPHNPPGRLSNDVSLHQRPV